MDSEVQSKSSKTSKNAKNKLTTLYKKIEKRNKSIKNNIGGENEGVAPQNKEESPPNEKNIVQDPFKSINSRLTRHRNDLDRFNGIIIRMGNALTDTKQEVTTLDDFNTLSEGITLMKDQIEDINTKLDDIVKKTDERTEKDTSEQKDKAVNVVKQLRNMKKDLENTNTKVVEMENRNAEQSKTIESLEDAINTLRKEVKKKRRAKEWIETPKMEDMVKQASEKSKPALEEVNTQPGSEKDEVQAELGTLEDAPPKNNT